MFGGSVWFTRFRILDAMVGMLGDEVSLIMLLRILQIKVLIKYCM
jgi:hypothetical protein